MDGFEVCRRLKSDPNISHIPLIMVTALDQPADKVKSMEAGTDDFLTKPVDEIALLTRIKNLARLKAFTDEMLMQASTREQIGAGAECTNRLAKTGLGGKIVLVEDHARSAQRIIETLSSEQSMELISDPQETLLRLAES